MSLKLFAKQLAYPGHLLCSCLYLIATEKGVEQEVRGRKHQMLALVTLVHSMPCCLSLMAVWEHQL